MTARSTSISPAAAVISPEFDEWRWEEMHRLPELIIPFKRPVYEKVVVDFSPFSSRSLQTQANS